MTNLAGNWNLDPSHSTIGFTVRHAGISKVRGQFDVVEASVVSQDGITGTVTAVADATSFKSGDEGRDGHVLSADFLDVENFPKIFFGGKFDGKSLVGDLNLHGVTKAVKFEIEDINTAVDPFGNTRAGVEAKAVISRKDFGLTWNAVLEAGNLLVSDKVSLNLDLSFIKA
jgi:polyisoprenoid-binding protein YceI